MTDRGWSVHDLTEKETLVARAYIDGLRSGERLGAEKKSAEVNALEERIEQLEDKFGVDSDD